MPGTNLIVFRETSNQVPSREFARDLDSTLHRARNGESQNLLDALVFAGQLESSLWDCASPCAAQSSALTDALAQCFMDGHGSEWSRAASIWSRILGGLPETLRVSEAEGFAYYALHPGDFADGVARFARADPIALIGIRSIGTTLSAVAMAQLQKKDTRASRITVRPTGHPYDRRTSFTAAQSAWVKRNVSERAMFLVLDEGPGLSGSSFLSVSESLVEQGVAPERITMVGTRDCQPERLCTVDAVARWSRFGFQRVNSRIYSRFADSIALAGGAWREHFLAPGMEWPACWTEMESVRFLTLDSKHILKFEGFGRAGIHALEQSQAINDAGFGPHVESVGDGMHSYNFIAGQALSRSALSCDLLRRIASYCAFRERTFATSRRGGDKLRGMVQFNLAQVIGAAINLPGDCLTAENPVFVDGRMRPHEWIRSSSGVLLKVDAVRHGDDHFLPGPTDIAWDLAGAIVEWDLDEDGAQYLQKQFKSQSDKKRTDRLPYYILAYSTFRQAYCEMASRAVSEIGERLRLQQASTFYARKMRAALDHPTCRKLTRYAALSARVLAESEI